MCIRDRVIASRSSRKFFTEVGKLSSARCAMSESRISCSSGLFALPARSVERISPRTRSIIPCDAFSIARKATARVGACCHAETTVGPRTRVQASQGFGFSRLTEAAWRGCGGLSALVASAGGRVVPVLLTDGGGGDFSGSSDAAAFPSLAHESHSFTLDEAFSLGLPLVVSDAGALPERVGPRGLVVRSGDAEGLADALRRLAEEPGLRAQLRAACPSEPPIPFPEHLSRLDAVYRAACQADPQLGDPPRRQVAGDGGEERVEPLSRAGLPRLQVDEDRDGPRRRGDGVRFRLSSGEHLSLIHISEPTRPY